MKRVYADCEQYSDEWWALRAGRFTASQAGKIITPTGRKSSQYTGEIGRLIAESMGWQEPEGIAETEWMKRGNELENEARAWFSIERNLDVKKCGIYLLGGLFAASPDAVTGYEPHPIPCEFKVPKPSTHIQWLLDGKLPDAHRAQVHFQMIVLDAPFAYFQSYHPEIEPLVLKVERDEYTEKLHGLMLDASAEYWKAHARIIGGDNGEV